MTWNQLKWIAIVSMTIDHIDKFIPIQVILLEYAGVELETSFILIRFFTVIGRIAFPIYAYGIAQGMVYTSGQLKYFLRLFVFALISEIPFQLANFGSDWSFGTRNVLFTLLLGAVSCWIVQCFRKKNLGWVAVFPVAILVLVAEILHMDYGGMGILFIVIPFIFFSNRKMCLGSLFALSIILYVFVNQFTGSGFYWMEDFQNFEIVALKLFGAVIGVALLLFYHGEKGKSKSRWFFYVYYPAHLLVLYAISEMVLI